MDTAGWPTKACLACVAVYQVEFSPHSDPGARLFVLVNDKGAVFETKVLVVFGKEPVITIIIKKDGGGKYLHWEDFFFQPITRPCLIITIHEDISSCRVTMEVAEEEDFS